MPILLVPELHNLQSVEKLKHENFVSNKSNYHREKFTKMTFRAVSSPSKRIGEGLKLVVVVFRPLITCWIPPFIFLSLFHRPKIIKIAFKKKKFTLTIRPASEVKCESVVTVVVIMFAY